MIHLKIQKVLNMLNVNKRHLTAVYVPKSTIQYKEASYKTSFFLFQSVHIGDVLCAQSIIQYKNTQWKKYK